MNKKLLVIPALLVAIGGGAVLAQTDLFAKADVNPSISAAQAKEIALKQVQGKIIDFDFDNDDNTPHYEIDIVKGNEKVEITIDAITGDSKITERENFNDRNQNDKHYNTQGLISKQKAKEIALKQVQGNIIDFDFDHDDDTPHYEIDIVKGNEKVEITVDAITGDSKITERETFNGKTQNYKQNNTQATPQGLISEQKAIQIAQAKAPGTVVKVELDNDDDKLYYDIEIRNGKTEYEFEIDAKTGAIIDFEKDIDDDYDWDDNNDDDDLDD
ncbi:PepSY domain-containing protein [Solibacillus sp. FSL K6-1523]|uniref:PepSY domain-containing protein n=1 Tax=Solibacillus sp. FSL K6-1523 TaxID=2921471 RepID=UPI0030F662D3